MKLKGELSVCSSNVVIARVSCDAEHFIKVALFAHGVGAWGRLDPRNLSLSWAFTRPRSRENDAAGRLWRTIPQDSVHFLALGRASACRSVGVEPATWGERRSCSA